MPAGDRGWAEGRRGWVHPTKIYARRLHCALLVPRFWRYRYGSFVLGSTLDPRIGMGRPGDRGSGDRRHVAAAARAASGSTGECVLIG